MTHSLFFRKGSESILAWTCQICVKKVNPIKGKHHSWSWKILRSWMVLHPGRLTAGSPTPWKERNPWSGSHPLSGNYWVVVLNMFYFHPYLGKMNPFWRIFFKWVETTNQIMWTSRQSSGVLFASRESMCIQLYQWKMPRQILHSLLVHPAHELTPFQVGGWKTWGKKTMFLLFRFIWVY